MKFLENKTPQVYFGNIHALITELMCTYKTELVKVNGCGGLFQLQMRIPFPFLHAKDLCRFLLIVRKSRFLLSFTYRVHTKG